MNLIYSFFLNSPWLGLIAVTVVAVVAALVCYAIMRTLLSSRIASDSELLSRDIIARLGALHALILSLMFVQEMADYRYITQTISQGVSGIRDVYNGLKEFDRENPESTRAINERIFAYAHAVLRRDFTRLAPPPSVVEPGMSINTSTESCGIFSLLMTSRKTCVPRCCRTGTSSPNCVSNLKPR